MLPDRTNGYEQKGRCVPTSGTLISVAVAAAKRTATRKSARRMLRDDAIDAFGVVQA